MSIGDLINNKLMILALQGYNPFQVDVGIFSGGYQGIMYPNPTTLVYPGFDPYEHTEPTISPYTPSASYAGLGVGNPGIDYKNAGHILGLFDTFARMSYGIGCLLAIMNGDDVPGGPVIDFGLPMVDSEFSDVSLSFSDIYPAYTEVPSDWINGFSIGSTGKITPDPRSKTLFVSGGGHIPITSEIDIEGLNFLFGNASIFSYIGMPQFFRSVIAALNEAAQPLAVLTSNEFTLSEDEYFNDIAHVTSFAPKNDPHEIRLSKGTVYTQCAVNDPAVALKTLNGFDNYHDGQNGQNEYRSLTELNSVINLIPLQMVGATYWTDTKGFTFVFPPGDFITSEQSGRTFKVASYMIADMVFNVSDIPIDPDTLDPGTVTITGTATIHNIVSDPTAYYFTETRRLLGSRDGLSAVDPTPPGEEITTIHGATENYFKNIEISLCAKNDLSWDKNWLDAGEVNEKISWSGMQLSEHITGGSSAEGLVVLPTEDLVVEFSKTVTLDKGCTSIRLRAFLQNEHVIANRPFTDMDNWVAEIFCHTHSATPFVLPTFHCHAPVGVTFNGPIGSRDDVPDNLTTPNIELSITVTGTNMEPVVMNVAL